MAIKRDDLEFEALSILAENHDPIGSSTLNALLREAGLNVSAATIGRMLSDFDYRGMTVKHGYRGRLVTEKGLDKLAELREKFQWENLSAKFYDALDVPTKDTLIDVLIARRGIERETTRLAAMKATSDDIDLICKALEIQSEKAASGIQIFESDLAFHRAIAAASKNKILAAAYDFIWQNGKFSPFIEYIRNYVGGKIVIDHGKILSAIVQRNPHEAEQAMIAHIESLIDDVDKYWNLAYKR